MSGFNPTQPEIPFAYKKFVNQLQAAGVNPIANGSTSLGLKATLAALGRDQGVPVGKRVLV